MQQITGQLFCAALIGLVVLSSPVYSSSKLSENTKNLNWQWQYDRDGRLEEITAPGNVTTRITYKQSETKEGKVFTTTIATGSEQRKFKRDNQGRLLSAEKSGGSVAFIRNANGLPIEVRSDGAPTLYYKYNLQNRLVETSIGKSTAIQYRYDYLGRLATIATPAGEITYSYNRAENRTARRLPNGLQTFRKYDDEGKLIELTHVDSKNLIIAKYTYAFRPDGLIGAITEWNQRNGSQVCQYKYNLMHRLTDVECGGKNNSYHYRYDSLGNLAESQTNREQTLHFTSTPVGSLATDSRGTSLVDERGHIRKLSQPLASIDYDFNVVGELASARKKSVQYTYNALGLLISRNVKGKKTQFLPNPFADAWQPLWRRDIDGTETVTVWDGAVPLIELQGKEVRYRLEDHLSSVRIDADKKGKINNWYDYTPYGVPEIDKVSNDLVPAFAGLFWDPIAKVYLPKARAYDPVTARFLQPDPQLRTPSSSKHDHSLYTYNGGDPVNFVDRNGAEATYYSTSSLSDLAADMRMRQQDMMQRQQRMVSKIRIRQERMRWQQQIMLDRVRRQTEGVAQRQLRAANSFTVNTFKALGASYMNTTISIMPIVTFGTGRLAGPLTNIILGGGTSWVEANVYRNAPQRARHFLKAGQDGAKHFTKIFPTLQFGKKILRDPMNGLKTIYNEGFSMLMGKFGEPFVKAGLTRIQNGNSASFLPSSVDGEQGNSLVASTSLLTTGEYKKWELPYKKKRDDVYDDIDVYLGSSGGSSCPPACDGGGGGPWGGGSYPSAPPLGGGGAGFGGGPIFLLSEPSNVGGVYLGGAGEMLEGLGQIKGIAVDDKTGKLVLIGSKDIKITLPPLRLDDVVTVFRAVYDYGKSPSVTIDPDEKNPEGPTMDVKHGPGTEQTYVGWILFECDRIMKTYQLGEDNVTKNTVLSKISGYKEMLDTVYFGGDAKNAKSKGLLSRLLGDRNDSGGSWERFWIVPASVKRFDAQINDLSLFELPLKVNTQKMRWKGNELVDDENGESSFGAKNFKTWFSNYYDEIADEVRLTPPAGSGRKEPVAIFHELRRIALITAIAERLREMGELMPAWMRDYKVASFPVSKTTPSLTIKKRKENESVIHTSIIYGGVNLAPADKDVYAYNDVKGRSEVSVPETHVAFVELSKQEAVSLKSKIPELLKMQQAVGKVQVHKIPGKKKLTVAILPGSETRALAPNRQVVTDMVVPIGLGRSISLTRYYNSFFDPVGELGTGWTFDLPRLLKTQIPIKRDGKNSRYQVISHLISPLGTVDIRFDNKNRLAKDHPEVVGISHVRNAIVETNTRKVLFRDGTEWHFEDEKEKDRGGDKDKDRLLLIQAEGTATRYVWDSKGQVRQILGYIGQNVVADIKLGYDQQGRIIKAKAKQADFLKKLLPAKVSELTFKYGKDGRLGTVISPKEEKSKIRVVDWKYSYSKNHLSQIASAGGAKASYGYDARGQLLWEKQAGRKKEYALKETPKGTVLMRTVNNENEQLKKWTYDVQMRPVEAKIGDGRIIRWQYGQGKKITETLYQSEKPILTHSTSQDGRTDTTKLANGSTYKVQRDSSGRPVMFLVDGDLAAKLSWRSSGRFSGLQTDNTEIKPLRHKDGWQNGVLISAPTVSGKTNKWLKYEWDLLGRPIKVADSSGFDYVMNYDEQGHINTFGRLTKQGELLGRKIVYNSIGLITGIKSSWGNERRKYKGKENLKSITIERQGAKSVTIFDKHGRQTSQTAFDNGKTTWRYDSDKNRARLKTVKLPNGVQINYSWKHTGKTHLENISMGSTVVRTQSDIEGRRVTAMSWGKAAP